MIPFEKFGDDFIDAVSSKLDLKGMSASPPDDDDLLGKGEIPKDAEEKLGGRQGRARPTRDCEEFDAPECVDNGHYCAYDCNHDDDYSLPTPPICQETSPGDFVCNDEQPFYCPSTTADSCSAESGGFDCKFQYTTYNKVCHNEMLVDCTTSGAFACGSGSPSMPGFTCQDYGYHCENVSWFSCFVEHTCAGASGVQCEDNVREFYCKNDFTCGRPSVQCGDENQFTCGEGGGEFDATVCGRPWDCVPGHGFDCLGTYTY